RIAQECRCCDDATSPGSKHAPGLGPSAALSVMVFVVPVVNLFAPWFVLRAIDAASEPPRIAEPVRRDEPHPSHYRDPAVRWIARDGGTGGAPLGTWCALWVACMALFVDHAITGATQESWRALAQDLVPAGLAIVTAR